MATEPDNLSSSTEALENQLGLAGESLVNEAHFRVLNGGEYLKDYKAAAGLIRDAYTLWDEKARLGRLRRGY